MLQTLLHVVAKFLLFVAAGCLLILTSLVIIAAGMRYLVGSPFAFTEELVALFYMAMVFCSIPIGTARREHIKVTLLSERVIAGFKSPLQAFACLAMTVFSGWFLIESFNFSAQSYQFGARSDQVRILLWPWMGIMPFTFGIVTLISAVHFIQTLVFWGRNGSALVDQGGGKKL